MLGLKQLWRGGAGGGDFWGEGSTTQENSKRTGKKRRQREIPIVVKTRRKEKMATLGNILQYRTSTKETEPLMTGREQQ